MAVIESVPNGSALAPIEVSSVPTVVGINFGNSYASIAVLNKEGQAECIANEDGERQIACAIAFQGEEIYIGNQAKQQLVKNAENTITGFRNLLGKKFSEIKQDAAATSAPVIQHPDRADEPAYCVKVLQPAPSPLPSSATPKTATPTASRLATPRSEPVPALRFLTPADATTLFLRSLLQSAEDFLGRKADGAVISVPAWFAPAQLIALRAAAADAGIAVLQLLDDAGAAAVAATSAPTAEDLPADRTQLVVDLGASGLALTLLRVSDGLFSALAASYTPDASGDALDARLLRFFAKDFTKKTKVPLAIGDATDRRAEARLLLALEHTKRTVSASAGAATCSVESLKDGLDYTGTINRLRFDLEARPIYTAVVSAASDLLSSVDLDWLHVDELVYVGGSACLPGLDDALAACYSEDAATPFKAGTVAGGGPGDPTTLLARGCALQAGLLARIDDEAVRAAFAQGTETPTVAKTLGALFPAADGESEGEWVPLVHAGTPLPARRMVSVALDGPAGFELWEADECIKTERVKPPKAEPLSDEEDEEPAEVEEEEEVEVKEKVVGRETLLGAARLPGEGKREIEVAVVVGKDGSVEVSAGEPGGAREVVVKV
ncbi:Hsp70 protein-domain-containing protein [Vararia minispora EC-137]|uniref:Hsp70 protein-domain-containing protein n=1 Tax=Vararia minispora EC-137 TaxID=1314806 RepID=A0ACB8QKT5_9AGAM|nr:Hsp70 protein-domain-containing protein [Vararia minispora EC-137]